MVGDIDFANDTTLVSYVDLYVALEHLRKRLSPPCTASMDRYVLRTTPTSNDRQVAAVVHLLPD